MQTGSLRRRLTVTCLAVLVVALGSFDAFLYLSFQARLTRDLDQQLTSRAGLAELLDGELSAQQLADRLAGAGVTALVRHDGTVYRGRPQPPPAKPPAAKPPTPPLPKGTTPHISRSASQLTLTETLTDGTLVLRADRGPLRAELRRLLALEALGSAVVLAGAALALTWLVRRALGPLEEMTRVATTIAAGRGGRRLSPTRTDTELGRMAAAFDAMVDALQEAMWRARGSEESMRTFLADVSHELRTPVAGVSATAEALLRGGSGRSVQDEQLLVLMVRQSARAGRLIDDLMTLNQLQIAGAPRREPVDLVRLAVDEIGRAELLSPGLHFAMDGPEQLLLEGDGDQLGQLIANLLDNAVHATAEGGSIAVAVDERPATVCLTVTDSGCGVPAADRERIFERLVRLDASRSRDRFGSGLGLSIARAVARAHGGELACVAHAGGARFELVLPVGSPLARPPLKIA